jgi:hypothetical protein
MQLVVSPAASSFLHTHGDRLYVWLKRNGCCSGGLFLDAATEPPRGHDFRAFANTEGINLFLPVGLTDLPEELHVDLQRRPTKVRAYWNGCIHVV